MNVILRLFPLNASVVIANYILYFILLAFIALKCSLPNDADNSIKTTAK